MSRFGCWSRPVIQAGEGKAARPGEGEEQRQQVQQRQRQVQLHAERSLGCDHRSAHSRRRYSLFVILGDDRRYARLGGARRLDLARLQRDQEAPSEMIALLADETCLAGSKTGECEVGDRSDGQDEIAPEQAAGRREILDQHIHRCAGSPQRAFAVDLEPLGPSPFGAIQCQPCNRRHLPCSAFRQAIPRCPAGILSHTPARFDVTVPLFVSRCSMEIRSYLNPAGHP
jgi:hypothetical protein